MRRIVATISALLLSVNANAQSWPGSTPAGTNLQWGLNRTVTPYQIGVYLGTSWYSIGTITAAGVYLPTFTMTGDCTLSAGSITCTTLNGKAVGTSGATIPLLNTANTFSALQTLSSGLTVSSGNVTVSSGNLTLTSGNATLSSGNLTLTSGNATLTSGNLTLSSGNIVYGTKLLVSATAPTIASGFGTSPSISGSNGTAAFQVTVGTGGTASTGVITMPAANAGWSCSATNVTTTNTAVWMTRQTASTTTSVTLTNYAYSTGGAAAWTAGDKINVMCMAF